MLRRDISSIAYPTTAPFSGNSTDFEVWAVPDIVAMASDWVIEESNAIEESFPGMNVEVL